MTITKSLELTLWFGGAFLFASLVEYWMHRAMHKFPKTFKTHTEHHVKNTGQGVLGEFISYVKGAFIILLPPFFYSWQGGIAWCCGAIFYAAFSAYAHQLQHDNPTYCAWMKMPVHYVHHSYNQWHHNFGLGLDWWDKIFGTYKPVEWLEEAEEKFPGGGYLEVKWR